MNTDGTLFSMKKNSREAEAMSMTSFMIPIGLKQKLKDHAAKLGTTSTSLIIEGIRLILDRKNEATPQLEEIDTTGADEYVKRKAIKTLLEAHLTTESPAQAWALAYRAAWKDALDFCIERRRTHLGQRVERRDRTSERIRTKNKGPLPGNSQKRHVRNRPDDEHHQPGISRRSGTPSRGLHGKGMTPP